MEIAFETAELRAICEDPHSAKDLSGDLAELLISRLADLRAALCVTDVITGHPTFGNDDGHHTVRFSLTNGRSLVLTQNHHVAPATQGGGLVWESVSRLIVISIEGM